VVVVVMGEEGQVVRGWVEEGRGEVVGVVKGMEVVDWVEGVRAEEDWVVAVRVGEERGEVWVREGVALLCLEALGVD
jgi:hypothetical protein